MKTIEEFIKEIESSETLQNELKAVKDKDAFAELLKKYDCDFDAEKFEAAIKSVTEGEVSDSEAEKVAGGFPWEVLREVNPASYGVIADYLSK